MDQFIDLCILCGCDYCDSIRGIAYLIEYIVGKFVELCQKQNVSLHLKENVLYFMAMILLTKISERNEQCTLN